MAISLCDVNERDRLHNIERLIRQSIPADDRRISASRLGNRPAHLRSVGQDARGAVIHPVDDHKSPARAYHCNDGRRSYHIGSRPRDA
jgi:hypothetical protein